MTLARRCKIQQLLLEAYRRWGVSLIYLGEFASARDHLEQGIALYDPRQHRSLAFLWDDPGVWCRTFAAWVRWYLGYPDQALKSSLTRLPWPGSCLTPIAWFALSLLLAPSIPPGGASSSRAGRGSYCPLDRAGVSAMVAAGSYPAGLGAGRARAGRRRDCPDTPGLGRLAGYRGRAKTAIFSCLAAEAYGKVGQAEEGLTALVEALAVVDKTGERLWEAELYRLYGELSLRAGETANGRTGKKFEVAPF